MFSNDAILAVLIISVCFLFRGTGSTVKYLDSPDHQMITKTYISSDMGFNDHAIVFLYSAIHLLSKRRINESDCG